MKSSRCGSPGDVAPGQSLAACSRASARVFVFDATDCVHSPSIE